MTRLIEILV